MAWPSPPDYNEAIQNPQLCFADADLRHGKPAVNALGLPWPRSGNNADVYKIVDPSGKAWAVKCFTREVHGLRERYQAVSAHLDQAMLPFMVDCEYLDEGILVHGQWYPVIKMRWIEGLTLNDVIKEYIDRPPVLDRLAQLWLRLAREMQSAPIVHGDLQHGNVLLVPSKNLERMRLRLIDYDGMTVPGLELCPSGELGHPNYQHPQRLPDGRHNATADRFAHLVIYTALRCLVHGGRSLWERYDNGDNLLFREQDFVQPARSPLFHELLTLPDDEARALAGHLLLASQAPYDAAPLLPDLLLADATVPRLDGPQRDRVKLLLTSDFRKHSVLAGEADGTRPRWSLGALVEKGKAALRTLARRTWLGLQWTVDFAVILSVALTGELIDRVVGYFDGHAEPRTHTTRRLRPGATPQAANGRPFSAETGPR